MTTQTTESLDDIESRASVELAQRFTPEEDHADMIAGIKEGLADMEAGRVISLEE